MKLRKLKFKKPTVLSIVVGTVLTIYTFFLISMLVYGFINSFKSFIDFALDPVGMPTEWHFENYKLIWQKLFIQPNALSPKYYLESLFLHSFLYAIGCCVATITATFLMSYATAKFPYKFSKLIYALVLFIMVFPIVGTTAAEMKMIQTIGWYDSFLGNYALKFSFASMNFLLIYEAVKSIPKAYAEAASVDGASNLFVMTKIYLPLLSPMLGTLGLLSFINYWNDYLTPTLYLPSYPTVAIAINQFQFNTSGPIAGEPFKMGAAIMVAAPIFILFLIFQKKLLVGVDAGGVKE